MLLPISQEQYNDLFNMLKHTEKFLEYQEYCYSRLTEEFNSKSELCDKLFMDHSELLIENQQLDNKRLDAIKEFEKYLNKCITLFVDIDFKEMQISSLEKQIKYSESANNYLKIAFGIAMFLLFSLLIIMFL